MADVLNSILIPFRGELAALGTALFWAFSAILFKRAGKYIPAAELNLVKGLLAIGMILVTLALRGALFSPIEPNAFWLFMASGALGIGIGDTAFFQTLIVISIPRFTNTLRSVMRYGTLVISVTFL